MGKKWGIWYVMLHKKHKLCSKLKYERGRWYRKVQFWKWRKESKL